MVSATTRQEVYVTGTVESFGGYTFSEAVPFTAAQPGQVEIGKIVVDGIYNGEYPWILRVYTDNLHFSGVAGAIVRPSPAGLVSKDGRFSLPLEINSPAFGQDVWRKIPDLNDPDYIPYQPNPEPGQPLHNDCILMAVDPRNANWVAGPDALLFTEDDNLLGDITAKTPYDLTLRTRVSSAAVQGDYDTILYFEIIPAP